VRLTFVGHATFLIESPRLVRIATDYNDYIRPPVLPDIITMNHAHDTHYTDHPDPAIKYVLRGWGTSPDEPAVWDIKYRDVRVRNVPTNIRGFDGSTERYGNSIFIFEIANLCIAHLGHLHHTLTQAQLNEIGRVDVVMAPVDGSYTLDHDGMMEVLAALNAPLIIPMHFFGQYTLDRFLARARQQWDVETADVPSVVVSRTTLPASPKVLVLPGR
jgi:L-ascorbate metabolism protein UlaG (beta-lactamase superfamily)